MRPRNAILLAAALVYIVAHYVPFGQQALYPLTLFTTWVHEMGHGLTALVLGGHFEKLEIFSDASGLAHAYAPGRGWQDALVSAGGLLAPPLVGGILLATVHGPKRARIALTVLAAALVVSMVLYVRTTTGLIAMPIVAVALGYSAWFAFRQSPEYRVIATQVLAVVLALDTVTDTAWYIFQTEVTVDGQTRGSDISSVAHGFGGPVFLWSCIIMAVAVALIALGGWWAWRRPAPTTSTASASRARPGAPRAPSRSPTR